MKTTLPVRTILLIVVLFLVVVVLLFVTLRSTQKSSSPTSSSTPMTTKPVVKKEAIIYMVPNPLYIPSNVADGKTFVLTYININTGANKVSGVQLEMQYDPKVISNVKLSPGTFFKNPNIIINTVDQQTGKITYAIGPQLGANSTAQSGIGPIAALQFTVTAAVGQSTSFDILPTSEVASSGIPVSVLKDATGARIVISAPSATTSPTTSSGTTSAQPLPTK